jgi:hypothetical protein
MELFLAAYQSGMNFQETLSIWMKIGNTKGEQGRFFFNSLGSQAISTPLAMIHLTKEDS